MSKFATHNILPWAMLLLFWVASFAQAACKGEVAVQVLGSGGPEEGSPRASSGYLVWVNGRSRVLIDAGGGVFLRFGESGAKMEDLDLIALSHFHADHVADLPALVKAGFFTDRKNDLPISGPSGNDTFPGLKDYLDAQFSKTRGAYRYLSGSLDGSEGLFKLTPVEVDTTLASPRDVLDLPDLHVRVAPVKHGPVPALGYEVEVLGRKLAFSGDQNGNSPVFWKMIENADLLIMHHAVPEKTDAVAAALHARPSEIGQLASRARVRKVVLSHLMARSLATLPTNIALIQKRYAGPVVVSKDMQCFSVGEHK